MQKIIILLFINLISLNVYSNHLWDKEKSYQPEIYSTLDSKNTVEFVKKWHEIASNEWGNYGPLEIYLVGKDIFIVMDPENGVIYKGYEKKNDKPKKAYAKKAHKVTTYFNELV